MANAVEINNLSVSFGDFTAIDNLNLQIPEGVFSAVVGPNGSGKTTFLKVLLGLIKPSIGSVKIFGEEPQKAASKKIGYVPQIKTLDRSFPAVALELVCTGITGTWTSRPDQSTIKKAMTALELVGAGGLAKKSLNTLSGGQLQRVYLARCFVRKPKLLLLDEPATGVDLVCESSVNSIIEAYNREENATVLMVTHDWSAAYHHTKYVLLMNKSQVFFGSPEDAFTDLNLQKTFSHLGHHHKVKFGIKSDA